MPHQAFGTAKKILEQINGLLNAQTDALQARDIKDMSLAFNKILGCVSGFTPGGQQAAAVSNVQIVMPPKMDELSHAWARSARGHAPKSPLYKFTLLLYQVYPRRPCRGCADSSTTTCVSLIQQINGETEPTVPSLVPQPP